MKLIILFVGIVWSALSISQNFYGYQTNQMKMVYDTTLKSNIGVGHSQRVLNIFKSADKNRNGYISQSELQSFQNWLVGTYKYKANETALRPDDFLSQGGGDCEDFAIMTCCMLNYHGIVAYIANYGRVTINKHALCLVQIKKPVPAGFIYYEMQYYVPEGIYIPIDYDTIGGLEAIDRRWKIASISIPKEMYGKYW